MRPGSHAARPAFTLAPSVRSPVRPHEAGRTSSVPSETFPLSRFDSSGRVEVPVSGRNLASPTRTLLRHGAVRRGVPELGPRTAPRSSPRPSGAGPIESEVPRFTRRSRRAACPISSSSRPGGRRAPPHAVVVAPAGLDRSPCGTAPRRGSRSPARGALAWANLCPRVLIDALSRFIAGEPVGVIPHRSRDPRRAWPWRDHLCGSADPFPGDSSVAQTGDPVTACTGPPSRPTRSLFANRATQSNALFRTLPLGSRVRRRSHAGQLSSSCQGTGLGGRYLRGSSRAGRSIPRAPLLSSAPIQSASLAESNEIPVPWAYGGGGAMRHPGALRPVRAFFLPTPRVPPPPDFCWWARAGGWTSASSASTIACFILPASARAGHAPRGAPRLRDVAGSRTCLARAFATRRRIDTPATVLSYRRGHGD